MHICVYSMKRITGPAFTDTHNRYGCLNEHENTKIASLGSISLFNGTPGLKATDPWIDSGLRTNPTPQETCRSPPQRTIATSPITIPKERKNKNKSKKRKKSGLNKTGGTVRNQKARRGRTKPHTKRQRNRKSRRISHNKKSNMKAGSKKCITSL